MHEPSRQSLYGACAMCKNLACSLCMEHVNVHEPSMQAGDANDLILTQITCNEPGLSDLVN